MIWCKEFRIRRMLFAYILEEEQLIDDRGFGNWIGRYPLYEQNHWRSLVGLRWIVS